MAFTRFIAAALKAGNAAIVLATKSHRESLLQKLKADGVDTDAALQQGTYVPLDAADELSKVMGGGFAGPYSIFRGHWRLGLKQLLNQLNQNSLGLWCAVKAWLSCTPKAKRMRLFASNEAATI